MTPREITRAHIMPMAEYGRIRKEKRAELRPMKARRQVAVGPFATFYFENYETMWHQIHEMLWIEKGGEAQIDDELDAYNPLVPKGDELIATLMFEIPDEGRRERELYRLGHVEDAIFLMIGAAQIKGEGDERDPERTTADGKTSAVHFVRFVLSGEEIAAFRDSETPVRIGMDHMNYDHSAAISGEIRAELARDLD